MATVVNNQRILGNTLTLSVGGKDYWSDIAEYSLEPADADKNVVTFADAQGGGSSGWTLKGKAIQSTDVASFWTYVWKNAGQTVDFILAPHGNETPSEAQPHFKGRVLIKSKPSIGTTAGEDQGATFDFEWSVSGQPELATTAPAAATPAASSGTTPAANSGTTPAAAS